MTESISVFRDASVFNHLLLNLSLCPLCPYDLYVASILSQVPHRIQTYGWICTKAKGPKPQMCNRREKSGKKKKKTALRLSNIKSCDLSHDKHNVQMNRIHGLWPHDARNKHVHPEGSHVSEGPKYTPSPPNPAARGICAPFPAAPWLCGCAFSPSEPSALPLCLLQPWVQGVSSSWQPQGWWTER